MIARLVSLDGNEAILLDGPLHLVGRDPRCDSRIDSPRVSRVHCYLAPDRGGVTVRDLGSTNGIRVNGLRTGLSLLRAGDLLSVADFRYRLEIDCAAGPIHSSWHDDGPSDEIRRYRYDE